MSKLELLDALQKAIDEYFRLLLQSYPAYKRNDEFSNFGPPELCELAVKAHAYLLALGDKKRARLAYLGFDMLFPFDNPVDMFSWRKNVRENRVDHTIYASIAIRIDSELKRLRIVLEQDAEGEYDRVPVEVFLVSKDRYVSETGTTEPSKRREKAVGPPSQPSVQIGTVYISNTGDTAAINELEKLEKKTTVWSNVSNVINTLRGAFFG